VKKFKKSTARRTLDKLWSEIIHARDKRCIWCGRKHGKLDAHHIISKGRAGLVGRYDTSNGCLLCFYCHRIKVHNSFPVEWADFIRVWLHDNDLDYNQLKLTYDGAYWKLTKHNYESKKKIFESVLKELLNKPLTEQEKDGII